MSTKNDLKSSKPANCPLCDGEALAYKIAETGQIRCWPCNLRLENFNGVDAAKGAWNRRAGKVENIPEATETPAIVPVEKPKTLEEFITQKVGPYYVADRVIKKGIGTRIKTSDFERYKKLFEMT